MLCYVNESTMPGTAQLLAYRFIKTATKCKIIGVKPNEAAPMYDMALQTVAINSMP